MGRGLQSKSCVDRTSKSWKNAPFQWWPWLQRKGMDGRHSSSHGRKLARGCHFSGAKSIYWRQELLNHWASGREWNGPPFNPPHVGTTTCLAVLSLRSIGQGFAGSILLG